MPIKELVKHFLIGTAVMILFATLVSSIFNADIGATFLAFNLSTAVMFTANKIKNTAVTAVILSPALLIGGWVGIAIAVAVQVLATVYFTKPTQL